MTLVTLRKYQWQSCTNQNNTQGLMKLLCFLPCSVAGCLVSPQSDYLNTLHPAWTSTKGAERGAHIWEQGRRNDFIIIFFVFVLFSFFCFFVFFFFVFFLLSFYHDRNPGPKNDWVTKSIRLASVLVGKLRQEEPNLQPVVATWAPLKSEQNGGCILWKEVKRREKRGHIGCSCSSAWDLGGGA